jgi:hypothetical protein
MTASRPAPCHSPVPLAYLVGWSHGAVRHLPAGPIPASMALEDPIVILTACPSISYDKAILVGTWHTSGLCGGWVSGLAGAGSLGSGGAASAKGVNTAPRAAAPRP